MHCIMGLRLGDYIRSTSLYASRCFSVNTAGLVSVVSVKTQQQRISQFSVEVRRPLKLRGSVCGGDGEADARSLGDPVAPPPASFLKSRELTGG